MISASGVLVAMAWVISSMADSLFLLYLGAAIGGIGAGVIYGGSVGNALQSSPDRRGLAAGLTAAGFGAGSALTVDSHRQHDPDERLPMPRSSGSGWDGDRRCLSWAPFCARLTSDEVPAKRPPPWQQSGARLRRGDVLPDPGLLGHVS